MQIASIVFLSLCGVFSIDFVQDCDDDENNSNDNDDDE